jgi:short-subunit dehydrogenase
MTQTVLITGASAGIGAALAARYARSGVRLGLVARNRQRLDEVAAECRRLGAAEIHCFPADVTARTALMDWISGFDGKFAIDVAIANAGILTGSSPEGEIESPDLSLRLLETNILGVVNTLHPVIPAMMARRRGQIGIMSSLAGFIPMPDMPSYSASKAWALNYGQALRTLLRPYGIGVSVICPGFVTSAMTDQIIGTKHFEMPAGRAAELIQDGLARNRSIVAFPFFFGWLTRFGGILPEFLRRYTTKPFELKIARRDGP